MSLGNRLTDLRKSKHLSQEEVAFKLNVTRQTVSKWETDQSEPDFNKIIPLCELYEISPDELLTGTKEEKEPKEIDTNNDNVNNKKRTIGLIIGIFGYFIAVAWIIISISVLMINPVISAALFILLIGISTCIIIYSNIMYKNKNIEEPKEETIDKKVDGIIGLIFLVIYLYVSFITMAWHITWIIWIICGLVSKIVRLIISLRGEKNEN